MIRTIANYVKSAVPVRAQEIFGDQKFNSPAEIPREMLDRLEREYPELLELRWDNFDRPVPFKI